MMEVEISQSRNFKQTSEQQESSTSENTSGLEEDNSEKKKSPTEQEDDNRQFYKFSSRASSRKQSGEEIVAEGRQEEGEKVFAQKEAWFSPIPFKITIRNEGEMDEVRRHLLERLKNSSGDISERELGKKQGALTAVLNNIRETPITSVFDGRIDVLQRIMQIKGKLDTLLALYDISKSSEIDSDSETQASKKNNDDLRKAMIDALKLDLAAAA